MITQLYVISILVSEIAFAWTSYSVVIQSVGLHVIIVGGYSIC